MSETVAPWVAYTCGALSVVCAIMATRAFLRLRKHIREFDREAAAGDPGKRAG